MLLNPDVVNIDLEFKGKNIRQVLDLKVILMIIEIMQNNGVKN